MWTWCCTLTAEENEKGLACLAWLDVCSSLLSLKGYQKEMEKALGKGWVQSTRYSLLDNWFTIHA